MKDDLRVKAKIKRQTIEDTKTKSIKIQNRVSDFISDYSKGKKIFSYIEKEKEVRISSVFRNFQDIGYKIFVPIYVNKKWKISQCNNFDYLVTGPYGVPQPNKIIHLYDTLSNASFDEDDIAIIPGLLFTNEGDRLGYGGGTFDRYLQNFMGLKIGICFKEQVVSQLPFEQHDIKMDVVITD